MLRPAERQLTLLATVLAVGCGEQSPSSSEDSAQSSMEQDTELPDGADQDAAESDTAGAEEVTTGPVTPGPALEGEEPVLVADPVTTNSGGATADAPVTVGMEDTCDGVDNDGNGIIDDVDVGMDGVCDCLRIATLGVPGEHGEGDIFAAWLDSRSATGAVRLQGELTPEVLAAHQVIIVEDLREEEYTDAEVAAFAEWVQNGGGAMTLIGYAGSSERENVNRLLEPFEIQYGSDGILYVGGSTAPVTGWESHPTTLGVMQVGADNGYEVNGPGGSVIATQDGHDVARVAEEGDGRMLVWADEWITYNSEWTEHPEYQVELFWVNILKWLAPANECQVEVPPRLIGMAR